MRRRPSPEGGGARWVRQAAPPAATDVISPCKTSSNFQMDGENREEEEEEEEEVGVGGRRNGGAATV